MAGEFHTTTVTHEIKHRYQPGDLVKRRGTGWATLEILGVGPGAASGLYRIKNTSTGGESDRKVTDIDNLTDYEYRGRRLAVRVYTITVECSADNSIPAAVSEATMQRSVQRAVDNFIRNYAVTGCSSTVEERLQ